MTSVDIEHPAVKEMIARRSGGDPDYVAGVRAYLREKTRPAHGTIAERGYQDAHDMVQHISEVCADARADEELETQRLIQLRNALSAKAPRLKIKPW